MKNKKKSIIWVILYFSFVFLILGMIAGVVIYIDPFFHYHKPQIDKYYYEINNQRSQNDGIIKHFDYDALITGTSMTENFKTSELDDLFGVHSVKVSFEGATYKEINDNVINALEHNKNLKYVIRGLDIIKYIEDKDEMRIDLGNYPTYLYDDNILNDVKYIYNRDVIFNRIYPMITAINQADFEPGITTFDSYSNWMHSYTFGMNSVCPRGVSKVVDAKPVYLSDEQNRTLLENVRENVTSVTEEYPNVNFYYFITPYSVIWWLRYVNNGSIYMWIEAERLVIEELLKHDNIKLFSFNSFTEITTDMNNYKDSTHYGEWINSLILKNMYEGKGLLTWDNYKEYLEQELDFYLTFDYDSLNNQIDYENDYYAAALLNEDIKGIKPLVIKKDILEKMTDGGFELFLNISGYDYLVFNGEKRNTIGQLDVYVYDESGKMVMKYSKENNDLDYEIHQYLIDVSSLSGNVRILFNGGYIDETDYENSEFVFSDIIFY